MIYNTSFQLNNVLFKISFDTDTEQFNIEKFYRKETKKNENTEPEPEPETETETEPEPEPERKPERKQSGKNFGFLGKWEDED